ncbi:hypothetical protein V1505DRAFT_361605 [Lipomyces doorenjongii]
MPVSLSNLFHTPRPRGRRRAVGTQQSPGPAAVIDPSATATSPKTELLSSATSHHLHTNVGSPYSDGKGYSSALSFPEIFHRLNPRYVFTRRDITLDNIHKEKQAAIEAGVIYGTRTYDWGTPSASVKSPTSATFAGTPDGAGATTTRRGTIRRILQVSKSVLRTKPLPSLPSIISRQKAELSRARTRIEVTNDFSTDLGDLSLGDRDALGITLSQPVGGTATATTHRTDMSTETRNRFSFDSSTNGSLLRNDSDASKATKISIDPPLSVPEEDDIEHDEEPNETVIPFPAKIYSAVELADITAFDFSDNAYDDGFDDMLIDEVNAYGAEDGFSSSEDSDFERPISHTSLTPISEQTDEDGTPVSSPVMSSPMSAQSREVVAYVRGSRGWVVERRMRKGGWGYQAPDGEVEIGAEVEEELLATERVERRAI